MRSYFALKNTFRDEIERMDEETMMWDLCLSLRSPNDRVVGYFLSALFNDAVSCEAYIAAVIDGWVDCWWNSTDGEKLKFLEGKTSPNAVLSTINPISTGVVRSLGLYSERPATEWIMVLCRGMWHRVVL